MQPKHWYEHRCENLRLITRQTCIMLFCCQTPVDPPAYDGPFIADRLGNSCVQSRGTSWIWLTHPGWNRYDEDCLNLDVYTPEVHVQWWRHVVLCVSAHLYLMLQDVCSYSYIEGRISIHLHCRLVHVQCHEFWHTKRWRLCASWILETLHKFVKFNF